MNKDDVIISGLTREYPEFEYTTNEMIEILCIPKSGLPLGWIDYENIDEPFFFPLEPATSIFQSATIAGLQGKGKTSFLRLFIMALTSIGVQNGSR